MSSLTSLQVLPAGVGYGIVVGIGGFFAALMLGITYLQNRYTAYSIGQAEEFNTASRSVKPGVIAAGIVSSVWLTFLLLSQHRDNVASGHGQLLYLPIPPLLTPMALVDRYGMVQWALSRSSCSH